MTKRKIIIATRGSMLALWQAEWIKSELQHLDPELKIELNKIKTIKGVSLLLQETTVEL